MPHSTIEHHIALRTRQQLVCLRKPTLHDMTLTTWYDTMLHDMTPKPHDMISCYMIWPQTTWYDTILHDMTPSHMLWQQTTWYYTTHDMTPNHMIWYHTTWYDTKPYGMTPHYMIWHQTTWYDTMLHHGHDMTQRHPVYNTSHHHISMTYYLGYYTTPLPCYIGHHYCLTMKYRQYILSYSHNTHMTAINCCTSTNGCHMRPIILERLQACIYWHLTISHWCMGPKLSFSLAMLLDMTSLLPHQDRIDVWGPNYPSA